MSNWRDVVFPNGSQSSGSSNWRDVLFNSERDNKWRELENKREQTWQQAQKDSNNKIPDFVYGDSPKPQEPSNPDRENYISDKKKMLTDMYSKPTWFGLGPKRSDSEIQKLVDENVQSYIKNYDKEHPQTPQNIPTNNEEYKQWYKDTQLDSSAPEIIKNYAANMALKNRGLQQNAVTGRFILSLIHI